MTLAVAHHMLSRNNMMRIVSLSFLIWIGFSVHAAELKVSSTEPVVVSAPTGWELAKAKAPGSVRFETYRVSPPDGRNATCLIFLLGKDKDQFTDPEFLKMLLKMDSKPYLASDKELSDINIKELKVPGAMAFYANFVDPALVNKPPKNGEYKTATPIILTIGSKYLLKVTILCDQIDSADYRDAIKIVESIKEKTPEA